MTEGLTTGDWRKARRSGGGQNECVEVKSVGSSVLIRDRKYLRSPANDPAAQPIITVPVQSWASFLATVQGQQSTQPGQPVIANSASGTTLTGPDGTVLSYTPAEWVAFTAGVIGGEFDLAGRQAA
jgi:hypothetical protein